MLHWTGFKKKTCHRVWIPENVSKGCQTSKNIIEYIHKLFLVLLLLLLVKWLKWPVKRNIKLYHQSEKSEKYCNLTLNIFYSSFYVLLAPFKLFTWCNSLMCSVMFLNLIHSVSSGDPYPVASFSKIYRNNLQTPNTKHRSCSSFTDIWQIEKYWGVIFQRHTGQFYIFLY